MIRLSANQRAHGIRARLALRTLSLIAHTDSTAVDRAHRALLAEHPRTSRRRTRSRNTSRHGRNAKGDVMSTWSPVPAAAIARAGGGRRAHPDRPLPAERSPDRTGAADRAAGGGELAVRRHESRRLILAELGRLAEAKDMATARKRYTTTTRRALVVPCWQNGEFELASRVVVEAPGSISNDTWQADLAPYFGNTSPDPKLVRARRPDRGGRLSRLRRLRSLSYAMNEARATRTACRSSVRATDRCARRAARPVPLHGALEGRHGRHQLDQRRSSVRRERATCSSTSATRGAGRSPVDGPLPETD